MIFDFLIVDGSATAAVNGQVKFGRLVDEGLKRVIVRCLDTDLRKRPSVSEVKRELQGVYDGLMEKNNGSLV